MARISLDASAVSRTRQRKLASRQAQSQPCAPFPSHSIRHADPFASKGLRDFGLPATSGNYPRRCREWSCFFWELIHRPRLERARWAGGHLKTSSASLCRDGFHCHITPILLISRQYRVPAHLPRASAGGRRQSRSCESTDRRRPCFMAAVAPTQCRIPCNLGLGALQGRRTNTVYCLYSPCV